MELSKWHSKEKVRDRMQAIYAEYSRYGGVTVSAKLCDLAEQIQADMSAENTVLRNRVDTLERALSVSDQHVADIVLANS